MQDSSQNSPKYLSKTLTAINLVSAGLTPKEALQFTNLKRDITPNAVSKFKRKYEKYSLTNPTYVKLAGTQLKRILQAEPREVIQEKLNKNGEVITIIERITPNDSNILAAASMVYDRVEPIITHNVNVNTNIPLLDLGNYGVVSNDT